MNPTFDRLQSYPFQKLTELLQGVTPNPDLAPISLYIGEPKHPTPEFIRRTLADSLAGLASYPATLGATASGRIDSPIPRPTVWKNPTSRSNRLLFPRAESA